MTQIDQIKFEALRRAWNGLPANASADDIIFRAQAWERALRASVRPC